MPSTLHERTPACKRFFHEFGYAEIAAALNDGTGTACGKSWPLPRRALQLRLYCTNVYYVDYVNQYS